jgi:DNA repair protein RecO (recombination protein O)
MARYSVEAIVLKNVNFKDADKIFTLFAKDKGKITATGKGVRKISSRRGGNLDTINHIVVGLSENAGGFKTITEVKTLNSFRNLKGSLENSIKGFYIAELVHKTLDHGQVHNDVFDLLIASLGKLDKHLNNEVSRVNAFEIKLMDLLGYGMYLDKCAKTGRKYDGTWEVVKFNPAVGGFVSERDFPGIPLDLEVANLLHALKTKSRINKDLLKDKQVTKEVDRLIKEYIRDVLEGELRTPRIFSGVEN